MFTWHQPLRLAEKSECAILLKDGKLMAKLSAGDMIAIEAKYHSKCLITLYNQARHRLSLEQKRQSQEQLSQVSEETSFTEVVACIDEMLDCDKLVILSYQILLSCIPTSCKTIRLTKEESFGCLCT